MTKEVPIEDEEEPEENKDETEKTDDLEVKEEADETEKKPKTKTIREKVWDYELVNDVKAVWLRPKEDITDDEYK